MPLKMAVNGLTKIVLSVADYAAMKRYLDCLIYAHQKESVISSKCVALGGNIECLKYPLFSFLFFFLFSFIFWPQ